MPAPPAAPASGSAAPLVAGPTAGPSTGLADEPEVGEAPARLVVRVLPDVAGLDKEFDYSVPPSLAARVAPGSMVRVVLAGRRVGGWITSVGGEATAGVALRPLAKLTGLGPTPDLIELAGWAAWRWAGRRRALLGTASPPGAVLALPSAPRRLAAPAAPVVGVGPDGPLLGDLRAQPRTVVRLPPGEDPLGVVLAACALGPALVVTPSVGQARALAAQARRAGVPVALHPRDWAAGAAGASVFGARAAAWAPVAGLAAVVVVDEHEEALQEERAPTWHARDVAVERARRAGVPCVLVSACPSLEALGWGTLVEPSRRDERAGWPVLEVVDMTRGDKLRTGPWSDQLVRLLRGPGRVLCVLNRTGRASLLACRSCGELTRCERCEAAVEQPEAERLHCRRCGTTRPVVCQHCGSTALAARRRGVARAREELEVLAGTPVVEVTAAGDEVAAAARVHVGTEAVLHRVGRADAVAFLDLDQELLAPRYRAGEQAMALLARAARLVGGRAGGGRLLVQTRLPRHEVLDAVLHADPGRLSATELVRRRELGFPPASALALVSGAGAADFVTALGRPDGIEVLGPSDGRWLVRASDHAHLCDALAATPRPAARLRVEVDPQRVRAPPAPRSGRVGEPAPGVSAPSLHAPHWRAGGCGADDLAARVQAGPTVRPERGAVAQQEASDRRRQWPWWLGAAGATVVFAVVLQGRAAQGASNVGLMLAPGLAALACWRAAHLGGPLAPTWRWLTATCASWGAGQSVWTWYESIRGREVPFPSLADVGYLGAVPLMVVAVLSLPSGPTRIAGRARTVLDGLVIANAVLLVSWALVLRQVAEVDDELLPQLISLAYPAGDVVTISIVLFALARARHADPVGVPTLGLVALGLTGFAVADSGFAYLTARDDYSSGSWIDVGWFSCFVVLALAARRPARPSPVAELASGAHLDVLAPYVPVVVAAVVVAAREFGGHHDRWLVLGGAVLLVLVAARQGLLIVENATLAADLEARVAARTDELRRSEETLRLLIEGVADHAIFLLDPDGSVASWNAGAERLFGHRAQDVVGGPVVRLLGKDAPALDAVLEEARRTGMAEVEAPHRRADGSEFDAAVVISMGRAAELGGGPDGAGGFDGAVVVVRDVRERRTAETLALALRERQRLEAIGGLAGGVAHDFNNLLTVISATASLLPDLVAAGEPVDDDVATIRDAAERGGALTRQLLAFSGQQASAPEVLDLAEVVRNVEGLLRRSLVGAARLEVRAGNGPYPVLAERVALERVLVNLVVNARDALPHGGEVVVGVSEVAAADRPVVPATGVGDWVCVEVADDGVGMDDEVLAKAFDPFFTTKPAGRGSGLGLASVYGIVNGSGGVVDVRSAPGQGTRVRCLFPRAVGLPHEPVARDGRTAGTVAASVVVVAEDEEIVRSLVVRVLERAGHRVLAAGDGEAALELVLAADHVDLVLTDLMMPVMTGRELRDRLRAVRPDLPVLFMSGHSAGVLDDEEVVRGQAIVDKPFTAEGLSRAVAEALGSPAAPAT